MSDFIFIVSVIDSASRFQTLTGWRCYWFYCWSNCCWWTPPFLRSRLPARWSPPGSSWWWCCCCCCRNTEEKKSVYLICMYESKMMCHSFGDVCFYFYHSVPDCLSIQQPPVLGDLQLQSGLDVQQFGVQDPLALQVGPQLGQLLLQSHHLPLVAGQHVGVPAVGLGQSPFQSSFLLRRNDGGSVSLILL